MVNNFSEDLIKTAERSGLKVIGEYQTENDMRNYFGNLGVDAQGIGLGVYGIIRLNAVKNEPAYTLFRNIGKNRGKMKYPLGFSYSKVKFNGIDVSNDERDGNCKASVNMEAPLKSSENVSSIINGRSCGENVDFEVLRIVGHYEDLKGFLGLMDDVEKGYERKTVDVYDYENKKIKDGGENARVRSLKSLNPVFVYMNPDSVDPQVSDSNVDIETYDRMMVRDILREKGINTCLVKIRGNEKRQMEELKLGYDKWFVVSDENYELDNEDDNWEFTDENDVDNWEFSNGEDNAQVGEDDFQERLDSIFKF